MVQEIQLRTNLIEEKKAGSLLYKAARKLGVDSKEISGIKVLRKSIDARKLLFSSTSPFLKNHQLFLIIKRFLMPKKFIL